MLWNSPVCLFFSFLFSFALFIFRHEGTNAKDGLHDYERQDQVIFMIFFLFL